MENTYTSRDFYLCGYLLSIGQPLQSHTRENGITTFTFHNTDLLQNEVNQYYSMNAKVNPVDYSQSLRTLKSLIHSNHTNTNAHPRTIEKGTF